MACGCPAVASPTWPVYKGDCSLDFIKLFTRAVVVLGIVPFGVFHSLPAVTYVVVHGETTDGPVHVIVIVYAVGRRADSELINKNVGMFVYQPEFIKTARIVRATKGGITCSSTQPV
jgi:hypothetical protein